MGARFMRLSGVGSGRRSFKPGRRSGISGVTRLRRKLRRLDDEALEELRGVILDGALAIELDVQAGAPVDGGDLVRAIEHKISRDGLTAIIGPGVKAAEIVRKGSKSGSPFGSRKSRLSRRNKHALWQFFKAYWYEYGTKGDPSKGIPPQSARPFIGPAYQMNRRWLRLRVNGAVARLLRKIANG